MRRWGTMMICALLLVGCGSNETQDDYLDGVRQFDETAGTSDDDLLRYGEHYCSELETLGDSLTAMLSVQLEGASENLLAPVSAAAEVHLCPDLVTSE